MVTVTSHALLRALTVLVLISVSFGATGCAVLKAGPAPDSGFIEQPDLMTQQRDRYPFHKVWDTGKVLSLNSAQYNEIMFTPVKTQYLGNSTWWDRVNFRSRKRVRKDSIKFADYVKEKFEKRFRDSKYKRFKVVNSPGPNTIVVELAVVGLSPAKQLYNAAAQTGGVFVPGVGAASIIGKGNVAIEAKIRDGETGDLLATFADKEKGKLAPFDLAGMFPYWHAKNNVQKWAKQLDKLLNTPPQKKVWDTLPVRLMPF